MVHCVGSTIAGGQRLSANRKTFACEQREAKNCKYTFLQGAAKKVAPEVFCCFLSNHLGF